MKNITKFVLLAVAGMSVAAFAQTPPVAPAGTPGANAGPPGSENNPVLDQVGLFKALDVNGNGKVEASEFAVNGPSGTLFRDMDSNKDGVLTQDELSASHPPAIVDTNKDGVFSIDEFRATLKQFYKADGAPAPAPAKPGN